MRAARMLCAATLFAGCAADDPCADAQSGTACRWAGTGSVGFNVATPRAHRLDSILYYPMDLAFAPDGRGYVVDWNNHRIRRVESDDALVTILGTDYEGDGSPEMEDRLPLCNPAGAHGETVAMNHPTDVKIGPDGMVYVAAWHNNKIRVVDPESLRTTTLVGNDYGFAGDDGPACSAVMNQPKTLVFDGDGALFTIDQRNARIRKISTDLHITTIAGTGELGAAGDGGPAREAQFGFELTATPRPSGALALVGTDLYVADSLNNRIRRIDLTTGIIDTIAGVGTSGYSGDNGPALAAQFDFPMDLEVGPDGRLYVADRYNHAIRAIDLTTGIVETVAGGTRCDTGETSCADRATAATLELNEPYGVAFDGVGNLYIADTHNSRVMKVFR